MNGEEEPLQKLWKLTIELSNQLAANRELTANLKAQVGDVKNRAETKIHPGFQIDQFDLDSPTTSSPIDPTDLSVSQNDQPNGNHESTIIPRYQELQRQHKAVIAHNQYLEQECLQLQHLVRDLEQGLELVMKKMRSHAHNTNTTTLSLTRHYQNLVAQEQQKTSTLLSQNLSMQSQLSRLSALVREVYDNELDTDLVVDLEKLRIENDGLRDMLSIAERYDIPDGTITEQTMIASGNAEIPLER